MKIIFLALFFFLSSFSVAEEKDFETNYKEWAEKYCKEMSDDFGVLMTLRQQDQSLNDVLDRARTMVKTLDRRVFGDWDMGKGFLGEQNLEIYEDRVLSFYEDSAVYYEESKLQKARDVRDSSFADCYKELVLAK